MPQNKYDIPSQVSSWEELNEKFTEAEILSMCDQYLRGKVRGQLVRQNQSTNAQLLKDPEIAKLVAAKRKAQGN